MYLVRGGTWSGGVPGQGGPGPGGVYLVLGGVPGPGGCTWSQGGVPGLGGTWSRGVYQVWGVYLVPRGVYLVPRRVYLVPGGVPGLHSFEFFSVRELWFFSVREYGNDAISAKGTGLTNAKMYVERKDFSKGKI